jgi:hypothetical protein
MYIPSTYNSIVAGAALQVLSQSVLEFVWRGLRLDKDIRSGSEVNRLVSELLG